jgi:hypothetical protein
VNNDKVALTLKLKIKISHPIKEEEEIDRT